VQAAIPLLERGRLLCREREFTVWLPQHAGYLGYAYALAGRIDEGLASFEEAFGAYEATGAWPFRALLTAHRGFACLLAGRVDDARAFAGRALTLAREHGERGHEAWALRLLAAVAAQAGPRESKGAAQWYREAAALAGALGMRPLLARCRLELGTLLTRSGDAAAGREHLSAATALYRDLGMDPGPPLSAPG
jgi:tetratricopeptide (TPR) repeat protein